MIRLKQSRQTIITNIREEQRGATHRVSADVDGVPLWFESDDSALTAAPEAFGSAMLLLSLHHGRRLLIDAPVSESWMDNIRELLPVWHRWWGYEALMPEIASRAESDGDAVPKKALAFSGGVDSFYTVLTGEPHDFLVTAHGFDIPLSDTARMAAMRTTLMAVASAVSAKPIVIRTNIREHPSVGRPRLWERAHGGVLAAFGHVLGTRAGALTISSSYPYRNPQPWGSSFMTDPFLSSAKVRIREYGGEKGREEKVAAIARYPLVREHLRVCWENRAASGNCSCCGKCLVTMLFLVEEGVLDEFGVFEGEAVLSSRLDAIRFLPAHTKALERVVRRGRVDPQLAAAARRLLRRSQPLLRLRELASRLTYLADRHA